MEWRKFINLLPRGDRVVFSLYKKGTMVGTEEGEIKDIPISIQNFMSHKSDSEFNNFFSVFKEEVILNGPVTGEAMEFIEVRR